MSTPLTSLERAPFEFGPLLRIEPGAMPWVHETERQASCGAQRDARR